MSNHTRNTANMHKAIREKQKLIETRVLNTLEEIENSNQAISFSNIAKLTGTSKAWLYRHQAIRIKIEKLRSRQRFSSHSNLSDSKEIIILELKDKIKKLEIENNELRKQLEIVYGELHKKYI